MPSHPPEPGPPDAAGAIIRAARLARGLSLAELGERTGYSAGQVSRYERGEARLTDIDRLHLFADALGLDPRLFGLLPRHAAGLGESSYPRTPTPRVTRNPQPDDGEDPVRRRQLLASLAATAAAAAGAPLLDMDVTASGDARYGDLLISRLRDAMLGLHTATAASTPDQIGADLAAAHNDYRACRYGRLSVRLPRLITHGHTHLDHSGSAEHHALLAETYLLATRMLIKLDDQQLGWMAADRARSLADTAGQPLLVAEAGRNLAVLARKAGWHTQAASIALAAAGHPTLQGTEPHTTAQRGLLIQSAAYTAAQAGDRAGMRELTAEAAAIAAGLGRTLLPGHGGFGTATVQLHLISAEIRAGSPDAAISAALALPPRSLPAIERQARYHSDLATAYGQCGRRNECINSLLAAERLAPEETHSRPAVRALVSGLLVTGRTSPELRGLAARCGALP